MMPGLLGETLAVLSALSFAMFNIVISGTKRSRGDNGVLFSVVVTIGFSFALFVVLEAGRLDLSASKDTAMAIQRAAAEVAVKHVSLELGGKNPMIICPDADLEKAGAAAVKGMNFAWQGQSCGSTSRLMLHEDVYDKVLPMVLDRIRKMKAGDPLDPTSSMGPMNSKMQYDKTMDYIEIAKKDGATLVAGGKRPSGPEFDKGFWVEPTVFTDVTMDMRIAKEEVFGPILSILKWRNIDEVIAMANDVDYGLTASIWTRDLDLTMRFVKEVEAGIFGSTAPAPISATFPMAVSKTAAPAARKASMSF